ncbi:unnamed protein product [Clonostachys byssicola]|uniref:Heterokaryon incompatibility domain-containing protein n=1 Tax=Clonostachys byssicola TaxID=160290 RepID=A0A9N9UE25_9HYPO|nr:unnamed protein product [Clonostachys byssicola]
MIPEFGREDVRQRGKTAPAGARTPVSIRYSSYGGKEHGSAGSTNPPLRGFRGYWKIYSALAVPVNLILLFVYEPLRDAGVFDAAVSSTIFRFIPPKRVKPASSGNVDERPLYQPITRADEIRLIVLDPGAPGDALTCRLINVRQSWRTRYEALSYTWGDPSVTRPLSCSGHTIDITVSLHDALTDLRHRRRRRLLWVDAVCINQTDNDEKGQQVKLMGSIYSRARRVLIYLGKSDEGVAGAAKDIRWLDWKFMPLHIQRYSTRLAAFGLPGTLIHERLPKMKPIRSDNFNWGNVINLLRRPWFERTWIIQEAILAKRAWVIYGDQSIPWAMLERVVVAMDAYKGLVAPIPDYKMIEDAAAGVHMIRSARRDRHQFVVTPDMQLFLWLTQKWRKLNEYSKLLDLILDCRKFACTNPRDKIYGMLGVTNQDTSHELLHPNYDLSPQEVYRNFVMWDILHNKSLRVLGCSWDKTAPEQISSWIPDFTRLDKYHHLMRLENRASFHAGGDSQIAARLSPDGSVLHLKGKVVDRLHVVGNHMLGSRWEASVDRLTYLMIREAVAIWKATQKRLESRIRVHEDDEGLGKNAFVRALVGDRTDFGRKATLVFLNNVSHMVREMGSSKGAVGSSHNRTLEAFLTIAMSRRFAATELGMIGYVPKAAVPGDLVVVFYGSSVPSVVRLDGEGKTTLVGECYIHGIMDGEAMGASYGAKEVEFALH